MKKGRARIGLLLVMLLCASCGFPAEEPDTLESLLSAPVTETVSGTTEEETAATEALLTEPVETEMPAEQTGVAQPQEGSSQGYAYRSISPEAQIVYEEVLNCILSHDTKITVSTTDQDVLDLAYEAVRADYGGLFWVENYVYTTYTVQGEVTQLEFAPNYTMDQEERMVMQRSIDASVEQMLSGCSPTASDYEKMKYVFETLIRNVEYELPASKSAKLTFG